MQEHDLVVEACLELETFAQLHEMTHLASAMRKAVAAARLDTMPHASCAEQISCEPLQTSYAKTGNVTPFRTKL